MIYYKTSLFTYNEFIKENRYDKLSKTERLEQPSSGVVSFLKIDEIFDSEINDLDYVENKHNHPKYDNESNITYLFKTKSGVEYRLDFVILKEDNQNLKDIRLHNKKFISVSFSLSNSNNQNYDNIANLNEVYDLMGRIKYLISLNEYKLKYNYVFMFGKPSGRKIKMYEYFIKLCFSDYKLIVDFTSGFPNTNIGYYLIK